MDLAVLKDSVRLKMYYYWQEILTRAVSNRVNQNMVLSQEALKRAEEIGLNLAILWKSETINYIIFEQMLLAALFDNIGIPDEILLKKYGLTDDERKIMEDHPRLAFDAAVLCELGLPTTLIGIHHERLDGKGYPRQKEITGWPEQIFIFVIKFSALINSRPWRGGFNLTDACKMLKADQGLVSPEITKGIMGVFKYEYR